MRGLIVWLLLAALLLPGSGLSAQEDPAADPSPRVVSVAFQGVEGLDAEVLRDSIATQESACRGIVLWPFCQFTDASLFVDKHDLDREALAMDELRIRVIYFRKGWRRARVESEVTPEGEGVAVTFLVEEGPRTTIAERTVTRADSVLPAAAVEAAGLPAEGEALDLAALDSARIRLRNELWDRGYADAVVETSIEVDTASHTAAVAVRIESGPLTTVDEVVVEGNEGVADETIRKLLALHEGQPYRRTDLTRAQRRLYETELFRQALVRVPDGQDSTKTVAVTVREAPPRSLEVGPGFNTVEFLQAEVRFTRYNWMGSARRLDTRLAVGNLLAPQLYGKSIFGSSVPEGVGEDVPGRYLDPTWFAGVTVTQPFFLSPENSLGAGVSAHRRSIPGVVVDRGVTAHVAFTRRMADGFPVSLTYRFDNLRIEAGDLYYCVSFGVCDPPTIAALDQTHRLSPLVLTARLERTDDPLAPTRGYNATVEAEHASRLTLSDFHHQRVTAELAHYFKVGRGVLATRARGGWVRSLEGTFDLFERPDEDLNLLHPRKRLLAGGARSVRGYGENQLGPRVLTIPAARLLQPGDTAGPPACTRESIADGTCDPEVAPSTAYQPRPLGGNTLLEGTVEYRHPLSASVTAAVFVDAGLLRGQRLNFPPGTRSAVTPGVGIRYRSPIGPVRIDLGLRPGGTERVPVVTELVLEDGETRLVQLDTMKEYYPLEGSSSFLGGFFSRLQLHLAIGEAF